MSGTVTRLTIVTPILFFMVAAFIVLFVLVFKALHKYVSLREVRAEKTVTRKSLGEVLYAHRTACKMTQEFVAEAIGVSRQAVSKWENGTSDPNTANLLALAKLYGIKADELIKEVSEKRNE